MFLDKYSLRCCNNNGSKRFSDEIITKSPKKEVDFKAYFAQISEKSNSSTKRFPQNSSKNSPEGVSQKKIYKYNIFKDVKFPKEFQITNTDESSFNKVKKRDENSNSPSFNNNPRNINNQNESKQRLGEKYLGDLKKSSDNISELSLGEFICINCDEFVDIRDMDTHFLTCEKIPENFELIKANYKLEKIKNVLLLDMKNDFSLTNDKEFEELLDIFLSCIQKSIISNNSQESLKSLVNDLSEIRKLLMSFISKNNKVYLILVDRVIELINSKIPLVENGDQFSNSSFYKEPLISKKIFAPTRSHLAYIEQTEQGWNRYLDDKTANLKRKSFDDNKKRIIFKNLENFKKNEEFLIAKPREVSFSPSQYIGSNENDKKEPEHLRKLKLFLKERENNRIKFSEKINNVLDMNASNSNLTKKDSFSSKTDQNRRMRFVELVEKLKKNMNLERNDILTNTQLYEECQNQQIHEKNWEGYMKQKFKNVY